MKNIKIKNVKLFNKGETLRVIMNKDTGMVNCVFIDNVNDKVFEHNNMRFYVNTCIDCGKPFPTMNAPEPICEKCKNKMEKEMSKCGDTLKTMLESLKTLFKTIKPEKTKVNVEVNVDDKKVADTKDEVSEPKLRKAKKVYPTVSKSNKKYYDYCQLRKDLVIPKNLEKYKSRSAYKVPLGDEIIKAFFHLVYKGATTQGIADTFNIATLSAKRYLDQMCSMGLLYHDYGKNEIHC